MNPKVFRLSVLILSILCLRAWGGARFFMTLPGQQDAVPASGGACDDGLFCNGIETCAFPRSACQPGVSPCGPGQFCHEDMNECEGSEDNDGNGFPDEFEGDCNGNGIADVCDIDCGTVGGVCDIAGCGMSDDCDTNGVPDDCDIQGERQLSKLLPDDGAADNHFGTVAVADGVAVVGAPFDDDNGFRSGSAYVFRKNGAQWVLEAKLLPDDGSQYDRFGTSVSVSGDWALVGAPDVSVFPGFPNTGAAYLFHNTGADWVQAGRLVANNLVRYARFGESVCLSGGVAVVGAPLDDVIGENLGAAYVYRRSGSAWTQEDILGAADGEDSDFFGNAVSVSGDVAVIGAPFDDDNGLTSGSAYVFRHDGVSWTQEAKLLPDDGAASDVFGNYVSANGDAAVIGGLGDDDAGEDTGSAYVFRHDGGSWTQEAKFLPADGSTDARVSSVSVSADVVVMGVLGVDLSGENPGAAYVFRRGDVGWSPGIRLVANDGAGGDRFGTYVSLFGDLVAIGAPYDDDDGNASGSAYLFRIGDVFDCNDNSVLDACDIDDGVSVDANDNGIPDECEPCLADGDCNDGLFCNGVETCVVEEGCLPGVSPCEPGETCYESIDQCMVDCNDNIVPDACDIECGQVGGACDVAGCGMSDDCDSNGVPDDCEAGDQCSSIRYVSADAPPGGSGTTWEFAFRDVQEALDYANATPFVTQIWVAAGVYETTAGPFDLIDGVAMYGGFAGWEKSPADRDWLANETVLCGAPTGHVVTVEDAVVPALLDGFTVSNGYSGSANGEVPGGGILLTNSSATIRNCVVKNNTASDGSGIAVLGGGSESVTMINCRIEENRSRVPCEDKDCGISHGGGMYCVGASLTMINCHVAGNRAGDGWEWPNWCGNGGSGGGIYFHGGPENALTLVNCTFLDNAPGLADTFGCGNGPRDGVGGGVYITSTSQPASMVNCYFQGNESGHVVGPAVVTYSCGSEKAGLGNLDDCLDLAWVDSGDNESVPPEITTDAWRQPRFVDTPYVPDSGNGAAPIVDMGAGEHTCMVGDPTGDDCNGNNVPDDCDAIADGDFDVDGDVDLEDFARFADCSSAPGVPPTEPGSACVSSCLSAFDADDDGDVDFHDYARFQHAFTGSGG